MQKIQIFKSKRTGLIIAAVVLAVGTGTAFSQVSVNVSTPAVAVTVQDDYVYYPHYGVYYNRSHHQFYYIKDGAWVIAPAPDGVAADVVLASPQVHMDFHDSPQHHHAEIIKKYPKDWRDDGHDGDRH